MERCSRVPGALRRSGAWLLLQAAPLPSKNRSARDRERCHPVDPLRNRRAEKRLRNL